MYVITNRKVNEDGKAEGLDVFGSVPNESGPNEIRLVRVERKDGDYEVVPEPDILSEEDLKALLDDETLILPESKYSLPDEKAEPEERRLYFASLKAACETFKRAREEKRQVLIFVHGYNNDMRAILDTAFTLEELYKVVVVPFSWPADGGGGFAGKAAYLDDKADARVSMGVLNRIIEKVGDYHGDLTQALNDRSWEAALAKYPSDGMARQEYFTKLIEKECKVSLTLFCHSMGNYLLKYALKPGDSEASELVFDNVALVAADANNEDHREWVERIQVRNRLYVVINENDYALKASRVKPGKEQKARLGHYLKGLDAENAHYIDVTGASYVKEDHSYFKGTPVEKNEKLKKMFAAIFEGGSAEGDMRYHPDTNTYSLK